MKTRFTVLLMIIFMGSYTASKSEPGVKTEEKEQSMEGLDTATFGAGCFWCIEAIFQELEGVESVISGYSGGALDNPTYDDIISGTSGHAEVAQITFDPNKVSYMDLLMIFFQTHDPTSLNKQGNDFGPQYRSAIFFHNDKQKMMAETTRDQLDATDAWDKPIVTEISRFKKFYKAEKYHQDYYINNSNIPYCTYIIQPKLESFRKVFADKLKK